MSTPTMNHESHTQQQQQTNETQPAYSNSTNSSQANLIRSDSTSTVILEEEETRTCRRNGQTTTPPSLMAKLSAQLRSLLKTSGLFNNDMGSSDKLDEFFASENGFALQRLLSEANINDSNIDFHELLKFDSNKLLDARTLSEFLRSESFDQLLAAGTTNTDVLANPCSFSELRSVSPDLPNTTLFRTESNQLKMESNHPFDLPTSNALNAIDHDHAFLTKRTPIIDAPSRSTISKRTPARGSRRTSSRLQSRAVGSTAASSSSKTKRARTTNRAEDIQTSDDLSYYLERRRKNNEASKMSRAARKQKFGDMDQHCEEYERVNTELRLKISTLEKVTSTLKNGLVNNFQRKN